MSQSGVMSNGGSGPGVLTFLEGDSGGPVAPNGSNIIFVLGGSGLTTVGNPGSSTITINEDGALEGSATTVGAVTANIITLALGATPATYILEARVAAFESSNPAGGGVWALGTFITNGITSTLIASDSSDTFFSAPLATAAVDWIASGNNAILRVTGVALLTINWTANGEYEVVT